MLQYLETYCDINEIEPAEKILEIGNFLVRNPTKKLIWLSRHSYILTWFQQLLYEEKTLEEFMTMGDIVSKKAIEMPLSPHDACAQIDAWMKVDAAWWSDSVIVIDSEALIFGGEGWLEESEERLSVSESNLFVL